MTDEQIQDGLAFGRLMADEKIWPALERLTRKLNDDAISQWAESKDGEEYTKKWLRGSRNMAACFLPAIKQLAEDAASEIAAAKDAEHVVKSIADDGMGSGDLAIA